MSTTANLHPVLNAGSNPNTVSHLIGGVSNKFLRGIVMKAKRKSIDIAKILFSCLNLKIISPISEIIHIIGANILQLKNIS